MRLDFLANIIVDQSHCNFHLCRWLENNDYKILFKDAGRVTRGGRGIQGVMLSFFESNSMPIPDIVAVKGRHTLIVEIDSTLSKARDSLNRYLKRSLFISDFVVKTLKLEEDMELRVAFCKTGITKSDSKAVKSVRNEGFDCFYFPIAREPEFFAS